MYSSYKSAVEYYNTPSTERTITYSQYKGPTQHPVKESYVHTISNVPSVSGIPITREYTPTETEKKPTLKWETKQYSNLSDPKVWGPAFWFTLHTGAAKYPISASPIVADRMKSYIMGIPVMLPCTICQTHASNHIEKNKCNLDDICSGRDKLFKFFVDFHNIVNKRYNKSMVSVEEAYKMYNGGIDVSTMTIQNN